MVYNINFSFDTNISNVSQLQNKLLDIAKVYDSQNVYFTYEENYIKNNLIITCVFNISFESNEIKNMTICINKIRNISKISLDCIFEENNTYKLIYASKGYLQSIEKDSVSNYKKFHKERSYSETDFVILKSIQSKSNKCHMSYEDYLKIIS